MRLNIPLSAKNRAHETFFHGRFWFLVTALILGISCGATNQSSTSFSQVAAEQELIRVIGSVSHQAIIDSFSLSSSSELILRYYQYTTSSSVASIDPANLVVSILATPLTSDSEAKALTIVSQTNAPTSTEDDEDGGFQLYLFPNTNYLIEFYLQTELSSIYLGALNTSDQFKFSLSANIESFDLGSVSFGLDAESEFSPSESEAGSAESNASTEGETDVSGQQVSSSVAILNAITRLSLELESGAAQIVTLSDIWRNPDVVIASAQVPSFVAIQKNLSGNFELTFSASAPVGDYRFSLIGLAESGEYESAIDISMTVFTPAQEDLANP